MVSDLSFTARVIAGFGRGSSELGFPTANLDFSGSEIYLEDGVYYGYAEVVGIDVGPQKMVMSVGYNPFFKNECKSYEVHILNEYSEKFYGFTVAVTVKGFIRNQSTFDSVECLILQIEKDIKYAHRALNENKGEYRSQNRIDP